MSYTPNITETVTGAGTDYTLTMTLALIDFGTTDPIIVLPSAGTYLLFGNIHFLSGIAAVLEGAFRDSTNSVTFGAQLCTITSGFHFPHKLIKPITVTGATTIQLWARNTSSTSGTVEAGTTDITYVRIRET